MGFNEDPEGNGLCVGRIRRLGPNFTEPPNLGALLTREMLSFRSMSTQNRQSQGYISMTTFGTPEGQIKPLSQRLISGGHRHSQGYISMATFGTLEGQIKPLSQRLISGGHRHWSALLEDIILGLKSWSFFAFWSFEIMSSPGLSRGAIMSSAPLRYDQSKSTTYTIHSQPFKHMTGRREIHSKNTTNLPRS